MSTEVSENKIPNPIIYMQWNKYAITIENEIISIKAYIIGSNAVSEHSPIGEFWAGYTGNRLCARHMCCHPQIIYALWISACNDKQTFGCISLAGFSVDFA